MHREDLKLPIHIPEAGVQIIWAVADAIEEFGEIPSGHLYANLTGHLSLSMYQTIISLLKSQGLVAESNHLLTWVGLKS